MNDSYGNGCQNRSSLILALFFVAFILTTSCRPMKEITIDVLSPAEVTLPGYIERVAFANRSYPPYLGKASGDTVSRSPAELYVIDTIFQKNHFLGLFDAINNDLVFDVHDMHVLVKRRYDTTRLPEPMTLSQIMQITDTSLTDALICMDGYVLKDSVFFRYSYLTSEYNVFLWITGSVLWRIYDVYSGSMLDEHVLTDTMEWSSSGMAVNLAVIDLPEVTDAYRQFSHQAGSKYGLRLTPDWYGERRYFYAGPWDMGYAAKKVGEDDWEEALKVWKELTEINRKRLAAKAAFNIALYYEMDDRLVPALDWAKKSKEMHSFKLTDEYIRLLERRIKDKLKLQEQVPLESCERIGFAELRNSFPRPEHSGRGKSITTSWLLMTSVFCLLTSDF
ncbi:MAG: hypothetical protein ISS19_05670 [Bacteroidales bacterium]|nr:hypothetical protein [Bacteroidales bacterium]